MRRFLFITLIFAFSGFFFFSNDALSKKDAVMDSAMRSAQVPTRFLANIFEGANSEQVRILEQENEALRAQLFVIEREARPILFDGKKAVIAKVYSTYPTNSHHLVSINAGTLDGVTSGMPVLFNDAFLFGRVVDASDHRSIVQTVFDLEWEVPAKIGNDGVNALFVGGRDPRLTLILKNESITKGDTVYVSSKDFPYGLILGLVEDALYTPELTFQEATVRLPYDAASVTEVMVLLES
ncbi:MAG: rod shape-determining protein MreC [Patescibacteria group bacterium]